MREKIRLKETCIQRESQKIKKKKTNKRRKGDR